MSGFVNLEQKINYFGIGFLPKLSGVQDAGTGAGAGDKAYATPRLPDVSTIPA